MQAIIPILLSALALSTALNVLLRRANIPTAVGYILAGTVLAAVFRIEIEDDGPLGHIAEFGIVFLMFTIGLEFSLSHLKRMKREVFLFGFLQVFVTAGVFAALSYTAFGIPLLTAIILGSALALSSTAIVLKFLNESGKIKSEEGRNSVGILIFQDMAVIPILLMISLVTGSGKDVGSVLMELAVNALILIALIYVAGHYLLNRIFKIVSETNSKEIYIGSVLLTAVGASWLAHHFGFSYSLGGFMAGMMIADTIYKYQVEADLIPFRDLLLGVFFVSVGLQIDIDVVIANLPVITILCLSLMAIKAAVLYLILITFNSRVVALKTAINVAQVGEFALVVLSLMLGNRMLPSDQVQILMVTVVLSMIATPFVINNADAVMRMFFRYGAKSDPSAAISLVSGHVVLLGFGHLGQIISRQLEQNDIAHVVVTDATDEYVKARELGKMVVFGDPSDQILLRNVGITEAMSAIIAVEDIEVVKRASAAITLIDPTISVIARVSTEAEKSEIESFDHELVLDGNTSTATLIVGQIQRSRLLARETSEIRYMKDIAQAEPDAAIAMIAQEQKRLLGLTSRSFNGLRNREDVMQLKAYHESFAALSEIIHEGITKLMSGSALTASQYETINILLHNHDRLVTLNSVLEALGRDLQLLARDEATQNLSEIAVEALDSILLTLIALAEEYSEAEMRVLETMTSSQARGFGGIRQKYLGAERELGAEHKALLLSATSRMDSLRTLFGEVGNNYRKLAEDDAALMISGTD